MSVAVKYDPSAFFRSCRRMRPFPPQMSDNVFEILSKEEVDGAHRFMLEMTNQMSVSMCPDLFEDTVLERQVHVVSTETVLKEKLTEFLLEVRKACGLYFDVLPEVGQQTPRLLVLGAITGYTLVIRLDRFLDGKHDHANWFFKLPICLREVLLDSDLPLIGCNLAQKIKGISALSGHAYVDVEDLLNVLKGHESFAWADERDRSHKRMTLHDFCHMVYGHFFGPIHAAADEVRRHVACFGNPYQENDWPCWRQQGHLLRWGPCLNGFQLTYLHCQVRAGFVPLLLYGVLALAEGSYLADRNSCMFSILLSCVQKLRYKGAVADLLAGRGAQVLQISGPVDFICPEFQYRIESTTDFESAVCAVYPPVVSKVTSGCSSGKADMENRVRLANTACFFPSGNIPAVGSQDKLHQGSTNTTATGPGPAAVVGETSRPHRVDGDHVGGKRNHREGEASGRTKRLRGEDDELELHYESDGEFGDLASGRDPLSGPFAEVLLMWKRCPHFVRVGFEGQEGREPLRFRMSVQVKNACKFCERSGHKSVNSCPRWKRVLKERDGIPEVEWTRQCRYPLCAAPLTHEVQACPTMHSRCTVCRRRGHASEDCLQGEKAQSLRSLFYEFAPLGKFTARYSFEPAWGWSYDNRMRLETIIVFQGPKRLNYIEWYKRDGDPASVDLKTLVLRANAYYWG